ncbi:hypothetical protein EVG20_g10744 [Dentipellis fragilis]|uniref:Uncharacterized protein n=1 Tax=Dentipellis fragilis TaxID=205917 RepID=A0A4Y9XS52_9AGAM|nr:hypothetical protein EVG20_g10744 [Dentipellis fragilis]
MQPYAVDTTTVPMSPRMASGDQRVSKPTEYDVCAAPPQDQKRAEAGSSELEGAAGRAHKASAPRALVCGRTSQGGGRGGGACRVSGSLLNMNASMNVPETQTLERTGIGIAQSLSPHARVIIVVVDIARNYKL